jgi:hypothetical protein
MLYRNSDGKLIQIDKKDYINDEIYYKQIISIMFSRVLNKPVNYSKTIIEKNIV